MLIESLLPVTVILIVLGGFTALAVRGNRQAFQHGEISDAESLDAAMDTVHQIHELTSSQRCLQLQVRERDKLIRELKLEIEKWKCRVPTLAKELLQRSAELKQGAITIRHLEKQLLEFSLLQENREQRPEQNAERAVDLPSAPELYKAPPDERDDLTSIRGIGKGFAARLNDLGIYKVQQIAALEPGNIRWMEQHLQGLKGRVTRDCWVEQALELCALPALHKSGERVEGRLH